MLATRLVLILLILLTAGVASAQRIAAPADPSTFLLRTPEARLQGWRDGLLRFVTAQRILTADQAQAIQHLAAIAEPTAFAHALEQGQKVLLAKRLDEIVRAFSYRDYLGMLRSFDEEIRVWLVGNCVVSKAEAETPTCTCSTGGGGCSQGYTCEDVTCVHEGGTTHNGRCGAVVILE